jgi:hypothetical protein
MSIRSITAVAASLLAAAAADAQYLGPLPYLSAADTPLLIPSSGVFHVEDFEDDLLTPGLTAMNGVRIGPGSFTDSVDADDGVIDGSGLGGGSYFSNAATSSFEFRFDAGVLGTFPTHAGVVWTDVGDVLSGQTGFGSVRLEAFDTLGETIGLFGPFELGDGAATGGTAEDRFLGLVHEGGISRLVITMDNSVDWEVDHVQYGFIPAPAGVLLLVGAGGMLTRRRR